MEGLFTKKWFFSPVFEPWLQVLQGLTRVAILGDFTRAGEGVAVDDISVPSAQLGRVMGISEQFRKLNCDWIII